MMSVNDRDSDGPIASWETPTRSKSCPDIPSFCFTIPWQIGPIMFSHSVLCDMIVGNFDIQPVQWEYGRGQ